jgi:SAM-dependent methyltransferase
MAKTTPFDNYLDEYEHWFDNNYSVFLSELEAIRKVVPAGSRGVEIGVGSGIFALPLGIKEGCDPSASMREKAVGRGINVIDGIAENLPYTTESFDYALMVTTICFVDNPLQSIQEVYRILKPDGMFIMGFVDKDSPVGKEYITNKEKSIFYKDAVFFSTEEIYKLLIAGGFTIKETYQTVFGALNEIKEIQQPEKDFGKGSFVVIQARKTY